MGNLRHFISYIGATGVCSNYRPLEPPTEWHAQNELLILDGPETYLCTQPIIDGQELHLYQLIESIAEIHGTVLLDTVHYLNVDQ